MNSQTRHNQNHFHLTPYIFFYPLTVLLLLQFTYQNLQAVEVTSINECLLQVISRSPDSMTLGEAKAQCALAKDSAIIIQDLQEKDPGVVEERLAIDDKNILTPFSLMAHNANYLLVGAHNFQGWNTEIYEEVRGDNITFNDTETQFQLSIKTPLAVDLFNKNLDIFAAYTVRSFWQAYNSDISSPFRETNHQPELWIQTEHQWELFGIKNSANILGIMHQSNGQSGELSRSWNRVYAGILLEKENIALVLKPWIRISEDESSDDNSDITDYLGHGEIHLAYKKENHVFTLMSRNNFESGFSKGAVQFGWSFPLFHYEYIKGYIQYFSGYGESLIDYNNYVNRIGFGILLTDIL